MKPEQVSYQLWRDYPWPEKYCARCGRMVTKWHEHLTKPGEYLDATKGLGK